MMLNEVFISKILRDCMAKYASEHEGKIGLAKQDVIYEVIRCGGGYDDVRAVVRKGVDLLVPEKDRDKFV